MSGQNRTGSVPSRSRLYKLRGLHLAVIAGAAVVTLLTVVRAWYLRSLDSADLSRLSSDRGYLSLTPVIMLVGYGALGLFMVWLWRARRNLDSLTDTTGVPGAGWAIGGWFVPIGNVFIVYHLVARVAMGSVAAGWVIWLVRGWLLSLAGQVLVMLSATAVDGGITAPALVSATSAVSLGLFAAIIMTVTNRQHAAIQLSLPPVSVG